MIYSQDREGITVGRRTHCRQINEGPGNHAPIAGLKVVARSGWSADRPSGTENISKINKDDSHLTMIISEAQEIVSNALGQSWRNGSGTAGCEFIAAYCRSRTGDRRRFHPEGREIAPEH